MGPAPGAPVPTEIPALHTGWGLRPPPISTSAAPWGWRAGRGAHFLQIIQQVHVQQVDVLARSDLHRGLFDVVLQLANDLETAPRAQCEPSPLETLRPAQDGGLFPEEGGSHSPSPAYHMKSRPRAPPQAPPLRAPTHGVPPRSARGSAPRKSPSHSPHEAPPHLQQALLLLGGLGLLLQAGQLLPHALQLLPAPPHQVGQHVVHVHAIEDVFAQLLPRHLGRGARPARGCSARRQPVGTGAAGRDPGVGNSFRPPTGSSVLFSGGVHWLGGTEGPRPQPHLHSAAAVRQPHGNILPAGLGDGPLVVLCVGWRQPS